MLNVSLFSMPYLLNFTLLAKVCNIVNIIGKIFKGLLIPVIYVAYNITDPVECWCASKTNNDRKRSSTLMKYQEVQH